MPDKIFVRNISDELWRSVKAKAALEGITLSEAVQEALHYYLNHQAVIEKNAEKPNVWMNLTNLGRSGLSDVSEKHDKYIAETVNADE
jgi:hypothetical protein